MVNKEIFDSNKPNISLNGSLKRNITYWQNTLMINEFVLHIIKNGYKKPNSNKPSLCFWKFSG